ncbi:MAG: sugar-binding domain-containing protein [Bacillota bacterium]
MGMDDAGILDQEELALYTRIAHYYYMGSLTQEEIAKRLRMSRQRVNRILGKCLSLGIVEIHIHGDASGHLALEAALEKKFGLRAVRVAEQTPDEEESYAALGQCAGRFLAEVIRDGDIIGFSRGRTLSALVDRLPRVECSNLMATQLMGGWNNRYNSINGDSIVLRFSERIPAEVNMLYSPVLVVDESVREGILREPYYRKSYAVLKSCTIAVLGITDIDHARFPQMEREWTVPPNAAGETCARLYDVDGKPVKTDLDRRIMALELEDLLRIPLRIGVAGMPRKTKAILGALRGGYINALVTDSGVAAALLDA